MMFPPNITRQYLFARSPIPILRDSRWPSSTGTAIWSHSCDPDMELDVETTKHRSSASVPCMISVVWNRDSPTLNRLEPGTGQCSLEVPVKNVTTINPNLQYICMCMLTVALFLDLCNNNSIVCEYLEP